MENLPFCSIRGWSRRVILDAPGVHPLPFLGEKKKDQELIALIYGQDKGDKMNGGNHKERPHRHIEEGKEAAPEGGQRGRHVEPKACHGQNIHGL